MKTLALMWPRVFELLFAVCLAVAPWLLGAPAALRVHDALAALAMVIVSVGSMIWPQRLLNLWNLAIGVWLMVFGLFIARPLHAPNAQSELLIGISLAMFAIIPSRTMQLPVDWQRFFASHPEAVEAERSAVARERGAH